jgi:hypothetical protein
MPAINHTPANVTSDSSSTDVLGIAFVSGFYGTGAWAAWILALTSSWYTIVWQPALKSNHDTLIHLLYTNWAAIDLFRQMKYENVLFGPLAAAATTTFWGLLHAALQLLLVHVRIYKVDYSPRSKNILCLLLLGTVVPSIVSTAFFWGIADEGQAPAYKLIVLPGSTHWTIGFFLSLCLVFCFGLGVVLVLIIANGTYFFQELRPGNSILGHGILMLLGVILWWSFTSTPSNLLSFGVVLFRPHSPWRSIGGSSIFKPCAPQGLEEWDQAFTLICGLVIFLYELGPELMTISRFCLDWTHTRCMNTTAAWKGRNTVRDMGHEEEQLL